MTKIFIGQRVADEYGEKLKNESLEIVKLLKKRGHEAYCTLLEEGQFQTTVKGWLEHAFGEIDKSDIFLAIIRSEKKSEGLLIEIGYCLAKNKKIVLAINEKIKDKTYLNELVDKAIEFKDFDDLIIKLSELKI